MTEVIQQLESQRDAIDKALDALRAVGSVDGAALVTDGNKRSLAQKARWAAVKSPEEAAPKKRRGLTPAGRKRLADNMRKRWAAKRTAAQAKKRKAA